MKPLSLKCPEEPVWPRAICVEATGCRSKLFSLQSRVPMFMYDGYVAMQATVLIHCISLSPAVCTQHRNQESRKSCTHIGRLWKPFPWKPNFSCLFVFYFILLPVLKKRRKKGGQIGKPAKHAKFVQHRGGTDKSHDTRVIPSSCDVVLWFPAIKHWHNFW